MALKSPPYHHEGVSSAAVSPNTSVPADLWNNSSGETFCNQLVNANMLHPHIVAGINNSPTSHGPGQFLGNHVLQWHLTRWFRAVRSFHDSLGENGFRIPRLVLWDFSTGRNPRLAAAQACCVPSPSSRYLQS